MRRAWAIARKELEIFFISPIAYVILFAFGLISGYYFFIFVFDVKDAVQIIPLLCRLLVFITLFMAPFLTMRLISEERRSGTLEILFTSPVTEGEIILGKFIGSMVFYVILTGLVLFDSIVLVVFGRPDIGVILSNYLGLLLVGGCFISVGLLASAMARNQIVAAMLAFLFLLFLGLVGWIGAGMSGIMKSVFAYFSIMDHFGNLNMGIIDSTDIVYFLSFTALNLVLSARILGGRR